MRLDKILAHMGYGSRKDVRSLIRKGHVSVNSKITRNNGLHVNTEQDVIEVNGEIVHYRKHIYIMLNKPQGVISATEDARDQTVIDLLPANLQHFEPFPVGRLDKDTEGLLLLTNDGQLAHRLTSPRRGIEKTYYAKISGEVTDADVKAFQCGVTLDDGYVTKPGQLSILKSDNISEIELTITEGKYHQVKRMFLAVNHEVIYLKRIRMGDIELDDQLELGSFRELNDEELSYCLSLKQ